MYAGVSWISPKECNLGVVLNWVLQQSIQSSLETLGKSGNLTKN